MEGAKDPGKAVVLVLTAAHSLQESKQMPCSKADGAGLRTKSCSRGSTAETRLHFCRDQLML